MRRRVVIFDENEALRFILWRFFDRRGYEVLTFPEPAACPLHVVGACPCPEGSTCADLILSDVNISGANGFDFIEKLVKKGCKQKHFALMSGAFSDAELTRASKIGCIAFQKPIDISTLRAWVEMVEQSITPERQLHNWF
jgi:DNA-binding NtrC family response regulator